MTSKPVTLLLADLGVAKSYSARTSPTTTPYSESQCKTLKQHPSFPERFGSMRMPRGFCQGFFGSSNFEDYHSEIALLTPADAHFGRAEQVTSARAVALGCQLHNESCPRCQR